MMRTWTSFCDLFFLTVTKHFSLQYVTVMNIAVWMILSHSYM